MTTYRRKPVTVEAVQLKAFNKKTYKKIAETVGAKRIHRWSATDSIQIFLTENEDDYGVELFKGDWVVKLNDALETMTDDQFRAQYEPVEEATATVSGDEAVRSFLSGIFGGGTKFP